MTSESLEFISALQRNAKNIRNICILAHVDHGKTTIADSLIASNGIISARLAGKMRYMDSRKDEQQRGITMKSSAISLYHNEGEKNYLVNLIDSPGHIDFSSEVSTAVRLCDGAIVVVDVVEGVCPQTNAVLRQAWSEGIKPCLILNKVDRLITELELSPLEAYNQLQKVLEQVNAVTGTLFSAHVMEQSTKTDDVESSGHDKDQVFDWSSGLDEADDDNLYFSPSQGNVVFASAIDGWAFGIDTFADLYSKKLGISHRVLMKTLWGDYFLNTKAKKVSKGAYAKGKKPLFVQLIMQNIWNVYDAVLLNRDKEKIDKIVSNLNLKISARDAKYTDTRFHLQAIMRQWLPMSIVVLDMVCKVLPSPLDINDERVKKLMCGGFKKFDAFPEETKKLKEDFLACSSSDNAPVIIFVSKMFSVSQDALPHNKRRPLSKEEMTARYEAVKQKLAQREKESANTQADKETKFDIENTPIEEQVSGEEDMNAEKQNEVNESECFIAFARVFSGTIKKGSKLYVLGPKYDPGSFLNDGSVYNGSEILSKDNSSLTKMKEELSSKHMSICTIEALYLMMGREFDDQDVVPAGNILGIKGLADHVLKSATVSSSLACPPFTPIVLAAKPIVRVAVEPKQPSQLPMLVAGMKLLNQADPCVEVLLQESGEHVIVAAGEVHLQRCLDDLQECYAKIPINVSEPIVPFRETVTNPPKIDMVNEEISEVNKSITHHSQRLPAFMLKEIQSYINTFDRGEENSAGLLEGETNLSKAELSEFRKSEKMKGKIGLIEAYTSNKQYCICLHAKPIPPEIVSTLASNDHLLKIIQKIVNECSPEEKAAIINTLTNSIREEIKNLYNTLKSQFQNAGKIWKDCVDKIWSIGPKGINNNILINNIKSYKRSNIWEGVVDSEILAKERNMREYDNSIISGFQLAVQAGPMCEEPLMGVAFFIEDWKHLDCLSNSAAENQDMNFLSKTYGLSGQHISATKEGCRRAVMAQPMRLMAAIYTCEIQATSDVLGKMYAVLGKREGKIMSEDLQEGSDIFHIKAALPVAESFGFAEEIRKKTSGLASPQLVFSRWEMIDVDPFWIPTTEEEYELFGEKADSGNQALKYLNSVRRRKGLYVEEKTVEHAEKQRTLKRNK